MENTDQYCKHCLPAKRTSHIPSHIEYYLEHAAHMLERTIRPLLPMWFSPELVWRYLLILYCNLGIGTFTDTPDTSQMYNRSKIFLEEARRRNIPIETFHFFGILKHEFRFKYQGRYFYFDHIPLAYKHSTKEIDNKYQVRQTLTKHKAVPIPAGGSFRRKKPGMDFGNELGFPLAVKPQQGSLSCHATYPVNSLAELDTAIDIAKEYQPAYIIEEYIPGELYRASVLGKKQVFVCKKERPHVIGDNTHTIRELIAKKNEDPKRKSSDKKSATLHTIAVNETLKNELDRHGMRLDTVPNEGETVYLHPKYTLSAGCDIIECTETAHPKNKQLFKRIAEILDANIIGIDFICQDITKPYTDQQAGVIETNGRPFVDMHQHPSAGTPKDVAAAGWDIVLEQLRST